jgi:hypothetical protein
MSARASIQARGGAHSAVKRHPAPVVIVVHDHLEVLDLPLSFLEKD